MAKKDTSVQDIAESIDSLATMIGERFEQVDKRFDAVEGRLGNLEVGQAETNKRLQNLENRFTAVENDIKELYHMVSELQKWHKQAGKQNEKTEKRISSIEAYVLLVAKETGIPYTPIK